MIVSGLGTHATCSGALRPSRFPIFRECRSLRISQPLPFRQPRSQNAVLNMMHERAVLLRLGGGGAPVRVRRERGPGCISLAEVLETEVQANLQASALVFGSIESTRRNSLVKVQEYIGSFD